MDSYAKRDFLAQLLVGASLSEPHTSGSRWTFDRHVTENLRKTRKAPHWW